MGIGLNLLDMRSWILFFVVITLVLVFGSCEKHFDEYPPAEYLNEQEQTRFLVAFLRTEPFYENQLRSDSSALASLLFTFKLRYFVEKGDVSYFLITEDHDLLFDNFICQLGSAKFLPDDTVFNVSVRIQTPSPATEDSVTTLFKSMIGD